MSKGDLFKAAFVTGIIGIPFFTSGIYGFKKLKRFSVSLELESSPISCGVGRSCERNSTSSYTRLKNRILNEVYFYALKDKSFSSWQELHFTLLAEAWVADAEASCCAGFIFFFSLITSVVSFLVILICKSVDKWEYTYNSYLPFSFTALRMWGFWNIIGFYDF